MKNILIITLFILSSINCESAPKNVRISFTGDIIMHLPVKKTAGIHNLLSKDKKSSINNNGFDFLFKEIKGYLKKSNITLGNMEFPISPPFKSVPWIFNSPPDVLPALKKSGFTMLNIANNHILDQGVKGIISTVKYLDKYKIDNIGAHENETMARGGIIKNINDIKIGFIAYTGTLNYKVPKKNKNIYINNFYNKESVIHDIKKIKLKCDYLVLSVHTGVEYMPYPKKSDEQLMKEYIDKGVDLIIGHHPHILQRVEKVISQDGRKSFIFYSLGNFISNQSGIVKLKRKKISISTRDSVITTLHLTKNDKGLTSKFELLPIVTLNRYNYKEKKREIQTTPINSLINYYRTKMEKKSKKKKTDFKKKITILLKKKEAIKKIIFHGKSITEIKLL